MRYKISNLIEMETLAIDIAKEIKPGATILLSGDLGAGKTTFAQMLAKQLGVKDNVTSPTFNILKEYECDLGVFYHMDAYRLKDGSDEGEFDDYLYDEYRVMVIEWPEYIETPANSLNIKIELVDGIREVTV
jgi:tRNA threonylcarbamoyladenosine biosynthesis protein TsaE